MTTPQISNFGVPPNTPHMEEMAAKVQSLTEEFCSILYDMCRIYRESHAEENQFLVWNAELNSLAFMVAGTVCAKPDNPFSPGDSLDAVEGRKRFCAMAAQAVTKQLFIIRDAFEAFQPKDQSSHA